MTFITRFNWPQYQSHEVARAAMIADVQPLLDGAILHMTDPALDPVRVDTDWMAVHSPREGWWVTQKESGVLGVETPQRMISKYHQLQGLHFGGALAALRAGCKIRRKGWNGGGLWLELQQPDEHSKMTLPYIFLNYPDDAKTTPGARVPWVPSQTDLLATDWEIVS
ncbi:TPA: DUF2829 domain-containing protein [Enterobacter cloacae]